MIDAGEKSAGPRPNCQTILPLASTSMTRLLNWSAIRVLPLRLNSLSPPFAGTQARVAERLATRRARGRRLATRSAEVRKLRKILNRGLSIEILLLKESAQQ